MGSRTASPSNARAALRIALLYSGFAAIWILASDSLLAWLVPDQDVATVISTFKGWLFVLVTAALLYFMVRRLPGRAGAEALPVSRPLVPIVLSGVVVVAGTALAIGFSYRQHLTREGSRLEAVASLGASRASNWLTRVRRMAENAAGNDALRELAEQWSGPGRPVVQKEIERWLTSYAAIAEASGAAMFGVDGAVALSADLAPREAGSPMERTAREAMTDGHVRVSPLRWSGAPPRPEVFVAAPLRQPGKAPAAAFVFGIDPTIFLLPSMARWPVEGEPGEIRVMRSDEGFVHDLLSGGRTRSVETEGWVDDATRPGGVVPGTLSEGIAPDGRRMIGVVEPVPGSDWYVVASLERSVLLDATRAGAAWILAAAGLVFGVMVMLVRLVQERQTLRIARIEHLAREEKLQALALLGAIAEASTDAIFAKDRQGRYLLFNPAASNAVGVSPDAVLGQDDRALFPADEAVALIESDRQIMEGGRTVTREETLTTPHGVITFLATKGPLFDAKGELVGLFGISRDINDRKQAGDALRESEENYRNLFESMQEAFVVGELIFDAEGKPCDWRFVDVNPAYFQVMGIPREEVVGRTVYEVFPALEWKWFERHVHTALTGEAQYFESYVASLDRYYDTQLYSPRHGQFAAVFSDVSDRKAAEENLRVLSQAVEQSPESVLIVSVDGKVSYANAAFCRHTGLVAEQLAGASLAQMERDTVHPVFGVLARVLGEDVVWRGELASTGADAQIRFKSAVVAPIRREGEITHYVAVLEDITERKRMADELDRHRHHLEELVATRTRELEDARRRAEGASRAKSAFLANMSHEIRTPMNAIVGLTHLLQRDSRDPGVRARLSKIAGAAQHLLNVISDILDLSKIEAGRLELEQRDFDLGELLSQVQTMVGEAVERKGLTLTTRMTQVPERLRGDVTRLRQALLNYVNNAVKFTDAGSVDIEVSVQASLGDEQVLRFDVRDTGVGIPPQVRARLFQAFEQADVSTTRRHGGSGLGLAITQRLAELMGGQVGVDSEPGVGSHFWFTVRLGLPHATADDALVQPASSVSKGARVLVAEDNPVNREVILELLSDLELEVEAVEDGQQAVVACRERTFDLVLLDIQMPVLDGLGACQKIRSLEGRGSMPIIALTANAFEEDRKACAEAGMDDFLSKPVDPEHLERVLARWIPAAGPAVQPEQGAPVAVSGAAEPLHGEVEHAFVEALARLLELGDMDSIALMDQDRELTRRALGAADQELRARVARFDFDGALAQLLALAEPRPPG